MIISILIKGYNSGTILYSMCRKSKLHEPIAKSSLKAYNQMLYVICVFEKKKGIFGNLLYKVKFLLTIIFFFILHDCSTQIKYCKI